MNVGIIENLDGSIRVVHPAEGFTVQDNFDRMEETGFEIDRTALPASRMFRNAWIVGVGGNTVDVDLDTAKELAHVTFSNIYDPLIAEFAPLVAEAEDNEDAPLIASLIADRKLVRAEKSDKNAQVDACTTVAQLMALMP